MAGRLYRDPPPAPTDESAATAYHARLDRPPGRPFGAPGRRSPRSPGLVDRLAAGPGPRLGNASGVCSPCSINQLEIGVMDSAIMWLHSEMKKNLITLVFC